MNRTRVPRLVLLALLTCGFVAGGAAPPKKLHGLTKADFDKLPPDAVLDVGGRTLSKAQLLTELRPGAAPESSSQKLEAAVAQIEQEDKAKADQANVRVLARMKPLTLTSKTPALPFKPIEPHIAEVPYPTAPGYLVIVLGSGFGERVGELHLKFANGFKDLPLAVGAGIPPELASQLSSNLVWADGQVLALTPYGLSGVVDQTAELVVVRADGKRSAPAPIQFTAARQARLIRASRVRQVLPDDGGCPYNEKASLNCVYGTSGAGMNWHVGTDEVRADKVTLKNGWHFHSAAFKGTWWGPAPGYEGFIFAMPPVPLLDQPLIVTWMTDGQAIYSVSYVIVGPRGVPSE